jgi:hypothetical protein
MLEACQTAVKGKSDKIAVIGTTRDANLLKIHYVPAGSAL